MRPSSGTSLRDRTSEFLAIAHRLQNQQATASGASSSGTSSSSQNPARQAVQQHSEFTKKASQIGLSIHKTSQKLQQLAQLAKRTSMFDDPSLEIDELTGIIKQDIQGLNAAIGELQRISTKKPDESKQAVDHSHTVVDNLRTRLKDATQEFRDVLTMRTDNLKLHQERRQLFSSQPDMHMLERTPLLSRPDDASSRSASSLFTGQATSTSGVMMMQQQQMQQQDSYLSSRAEALHNVEATIVELGGIFTQLAEMVQAQGEMTQRIDENIDETLSNVDSAKAQLLKYLNTISNNRWLLLKVLFVLLVFMVIFVVFIA
eukprot:jgi/Chrzof1/4022/Cz13g17160.t1